MATTSTTKLNARLQKENDTLRAKLAEAEAKARGLAEDLKLFQSERDDLRAKLGLVHSPVESVWRWQGDGDDHPETMIDGLPVVMSAATLKTMLADRDQGGFIHGVAYRCDRCDPSFSCFDGSKPCCKVPLAKKGGE